MIFRIYRIPGSKKFWHIDSGQGSQKFNVLGYDAMVDTTSVDSPEENPRARIQIDGDTTDFYVINGRAFFDTKKYPINNVIGKDKCGVCLFDTGCGSAPIYADGTKGEIHIPDNPLCVGTKDSEHIE
jgi:hypothetical protein